MSRRNRALSISRNRLESIHPPQRRDRRALFAPRPMALEPHFLDFDGDGALDLYLVNAGRLPELSNEPEAANALFRNEGSGRFSEQTARAGAVGGPRLR